MEKTSPSLVHRSYSISSFFLCLSTGIKALVLRHLANLAPLLGLPILMVPLDASSVPLADLPSLPLLLVRLLVVPGTSLPRWLMVPWVLVPWLDTHIPSSSTPALLSLLSFPSALTSSVPSRSVLWVLPPQLLMDRHALILPTLNLLLSLTLLVLLSS